MHGGFVNKYEIRPTFVCCRTNITINIMFAFNRYSSSTNTRPVVRLYQQSIIRES